MQSVVCYDIDIFSEASSQLAEMSSGACCVYPSDRGPSVLFALCDLAVRLDAIGMIQTGGQYQHEKGRLPGLYFLGQDFLTPGAGSAVAWPRETGGQTR